MAGLRGFIQGQNAGVGTSLAWPAGTAAGDVCWLYAGGSLPQSGPVSSGWTPVGHKAWWKVLSAVDVASPLVVTAERVKVAIFFGADRVGAFAQQPSVKVGAGDWMVVDASRRSGSCTPDGTYRLGTEWVSVTGNTQATLARAAASAGTLSVPVTSGTEAFAYQVVTAAAPVAPALLGPSAGVRMSTLDLVRFSWRHQGGQLRYSRVEVTGPMGVRTIMGDGTLYNGSWSLADVEAITLAAGLAAGSYSWRAQTENYTGPSPWSAARAFYVDVPPSLATPTVVSPAGSLTPTVTGSATAGYGSVEQHRVTIAPAAATDPEAAAVWSTGVVMGPMVSETAPATAPWTNGQSLRAWVTVWQTGGVSTTVASAPFTVSWTPTATPTVILSAGAPPMVGIGTAAGRRVEVEQHLGVAWEPLTAVTASGATVMVGSPLLASGRPVRVRARQAALASGVWLWSAWAETTPQTLPAVGCYLVCDADRSVYLEAHLAEEGAREWVQGVAASYGLGAGAARVDRTPVAGRRGDMVLIGDTTTTVATIREWLNARDVFWFCFPPEGPQLTTPQDPIRMRRTSPLTTVRLAQSAMLEHRHLPLSWVEAP